MMLKLIARALKKFDFSSKAALLFTHKNSYSSLVLVSTHKIVCQTWSITSLSTSLHFSMSSPGNEKASSINSQPEKKKMKMKSSEKSSETRPNSTPLSNSKEMMAYTESEPSLEAFEDEIAAEAYREEQELVFHVFSKTTTTPVSMETSSSSSSSSSNGSNSNSSSNGGTSFDDTQSLRVDPVTGHQCVFKNLADDEASLATNLETTLSLRSNFIKTNPGTSAAGLMSTTTSGQQSSSTWAKSNAPSLKTTKSLSSSKDVLLLYSGLANEDGQSSHVNAVLQLLYSWKPIPLYVRSNKDDVPASVSPSLHRSLDTLFQAMAGSISSRCDQREVGAGKSAKIVDTKQFLSDFRTVTARSVALNASVLEKLKKRSAVDFLVAILQTLHSEVNKARPAHSASTNNITSAETAWEHKLDTEDDSFLVHLIKGQLQSVVNCLSCGAKNSLSWSSFWTLAVPLPPPEALKKELTLSDCLGQYLAVQQLTPDEKNQLPKCTKCLPAKQSVVSKQVTVTRAPQYLLIHLDRDSKKNDSAATAAVVDARPVLIDPLIKVGGREYSLLSAIVRQEGGHYVTLHGLHPQKWVLFDDQTVSVIASGFTSTDSSAAAAVPTAQSLMRQRAYLLLYKYIH